MPHTEVRTPPRPFALDDWRVWGVSLGGAALVAAYYLVEGWLFDVQEANGALVAPSRQTVADVVFWWLAWALLAPFAARFVAAHPITGRSVWRTVFTYVVAAIAFALGHGAISVPLWQSVMDLPPARGFGAFSAPLRVVWMSVLRAPTAVFQFVAFCAVFHAIAYARRLHERELTASQLRTALAHAELDVLKARLEPHFLFNTLNTITSYIRTNPALAERMVARLARLLRGVLELRNEQEIPLSQELGLVDEYLDIQRLRYGERLDAVVDVDPATNVALVPALLLQPLVENALLHGLERRPGRGRVTVTARRDATTLRLQVEERAVDSTADADQPLVEMADGNGNGVGLSTTRSRLAQLHGSAQRVALLTGPSRSAVHVELPFRTAAQRDSHG